MAFDPTKYTLGSIGNTGAHITGQDGVDYWYMPTDSLMGGSKVGDTWYYPTLQSGAMDYIKGLSQYTVPDEWGAGLSGREISNLNTGFFLPYSDYTSNVSPYATTISASPVSLEFGNGLGASSSSQGYGNSGAYLGADGKYHWNEGGATWTVDPQTARLDGSKTVTHSDGGLFGGGFLGDIFGGIGEALMDLGPILPIAAAVTGNPILMGLNAGTKVAQGDILGAALPFVPGLINGIGESGAAYDAGAFMDQSIAQGAQNAGIGAGADSSFWDSIKDFSGNNTPLDTSVNSWDSLAAPTATHSGFDANKLLGISQGEGFTPAANLGYSPTSSATDALGATTALEANLTGNAAAVAAASAPSWLSKLNPSQAANIAKSAMGLLGGGGTQQQPTGLLGGGGSSSGYSANIQPDNSLLSLQKQQYQNIFSAPQAPGIYNLQRGY